MNAAVAALPNPSAAASAPSTPRRRILSVTAAVLAVWFAGLAGQPLWTSAAYLAYLVAVVAYPGVVCWRRLTGGTGCRYADLVLGTSFGLAISMPVYLAGRWADLPALIALLPVVAAWIQWRSPRLARPEIPLPPKVLAMSFTGLGLLALWYLRVGSQFIPLDGPLALKPNSDTPYQLAVTAELVHHFPPQVPYVAGEPLHYHWMAYAHAASAHWFTAVELDRLVSVLAPYLMLLLTVSGISAVALVLSGRPMAAVTGALVAVLAGDFGPWSWTDQTGFLTDTPVAFPAIVSPTQAMANVLLLPLIAITIMLYRHRHTATGAVGRWIVLAVLVLVLSATKATALPVYGAGVAAVFCIQLLRHRIDVIALLIAGCVMVAYVTSFFIVLGGTSFGMSIGLGASYGQLLEPVLGSRLAGAIGTSGVVLFAALLIIGWLLPCAALSLLTHAPGGPDLGAVLCTGSLLGAVAGFSIASHWSTSQLFLIRTGTVYALLLMAWGLACLERSHLRYAVPALAGAAVSVALIRWSFPDRPEDCGGPACAAGRLWMPPVAVLVAGCVVAAVVIVVVRAPTRTWSVMLACALIGLTSAPAMGQLDSPRPIATLSPSIPEGGIEAARFIRARSDVDDVIATNVHCRTPRQRPCSPLSFWIAAYAERRVLVQGWAYTAHTNAAPDRARGLTGPFWDPGLLAANDAVFVAPTKDRLARLRDGYGVRWLLADTRVAPVSRDLEALADLRLSVGQTRIYEIR
ncbi:MAG: hypothetical protein ACRDP9_08945 [Kribbellaceae bacterium]